MLGIGAVEQTYSHEHGRGSLVVMFEEGLEPMQASSSLVLA
jgi:hypothetical protein